MLLCHYSGIVIKIRRLESLKKNCGFPRGLVRNLRSRIKFIRALLDSTLQAIFTFNAIACYCNFVSSDRSSA